MGYTWVWVYYKGYVQYIVERGAEGWVLIGYVLGVSYKELEYATQVERGVEENTMCEYWPKGVCTWWMLV